MSEERCPTCNSTDRELLLGECADRATRYQDGGDSVRLRLVNPWHQHRETTQEVKRLRDALREIYRYPSDSYSAQAAFDMYEIARAALTESEEP